MPIKKYPIMKIFNSTFIDMPSPSSLSYLWNFGSLLGITLVLQITSGLLMTFHYSPEMTLSFSFLTLATRNILNFWLIRWMHANGASLIFILMYLHIARNIYFHSFKKLKTWNTGITIFFLMMTTAFMGYVLPWGQMSYWGVTVITNLLTAIPYIGQNIMVWLWGDYSVNNTTLKRFYSIHFLLPLIILMLTIFHLFFLHQHGSSNPLGLQNQTDSSYFHPFFSMKDTFGFMIMILTFLSIIMINPLIFNDPENFIIANFMMTPKHIQPEWYFLFAYAILRSIPSKLGGVIALIMSITILFFLPINNNKIPLKFNPSKKMYFWLFISIFIILTWIGMNPTDFPFLLIGSVYTFIYFLTFMMLLI